MSVCVYENTCPTWSEPLTVGGGVSIEYTRSRSAVRSKRYVPSVSQRAFHFASSPSRAGFSGTVMDGDIYAANPGTRTRNPELRNLGTRNLGTYLTPDSL